MIMNISKKYRYCQKYTKRYRMVITDRICISNVVTVFSLNIMHINRV